QASGPKSIPAASHAANAAQCPGEDAKSFLCDEQLLRHVEDLTKVNPVTATTVLKCLELRYAAEVFYTNAGCSLVAVNPFRLVPQLYSPELMKEYHTAARLQELKPHIFVAAEETYRNVESRIPPVNQSIIVSGESGAGKTWTSRCLMRFYATVAASATIPKGSVAVERIEKRVLDSNPVMEAFGNACTLRNSNSSRFGKYIQLQLNRSQLLTSASIQTFLLEKTRVAYQAPHERNFHIFYQIAKGATQEQRLEWDLPEDLTFSWLPNSEKALEVAREAMSHLGIEDSTQNNVFKILAGLLHLGNIRYLESEDESQPCGLEDFAKTAARLLQVPVEELLDTLRIRTITAGKQRQVFKKACPKAECETRRDCLAKVIYAQLFDWLVAVINESISAEPSVWDHFIGLLDVYGFESFPDNHLEQLCINYANEKLQQHFVGHFLKAQQEEYAAEGLEWSFIDYRDNQRGLDAIEGSPVSIFSLLNEECRLNRASSAGQLQARIEAALASNPCVSRDRLSKEANFIVAHFAGRVCYQLEGMVEKNKDPVPPELVLLLQLSRDPLLQELFTSQKADEDTTKPQTKPVVVTVVSKFKGSLEQLMGLLHSTTPHYIRCLKPNSRPVTTLSCQVLRQLEACGIVEAVNISAAGFPVSSRAALASLAVLFSKNPLKTSRFLPFLGWTTPASAEEERDAFRSAVQDILWHVCPNTAPLNPTESTPCATPAYCAKTKVFMTNSTLELLEARRAGALSQKAFCIQCCWRRFKRRKAAKEKRSATVIQSAVRSWLARKHFQRLRKAAVVIKRAWKKWKAKMGVLAAEELDGVDGKLPSFAGATASFSQAPGESDKAWPLNAIIRLWPLGLVLASAPVRMTASQSRLALLTCLQGLPKGDFCKAGARLPRDGIASIRALPQGSVRFRCRRSPLLHAEVRPHCRSCTLSGFNQILLDARQLLSA
uniref:Unconventional myosin-XIX n=1 Tax=Varanus komodoensis TaxID=61221 RepID=A0A8D2LXD0_VARKO